MSWPGPTRGIARGRIAGVVASFAVIPAVAVGAALTVCACPAHEGGASIASTAHSAAHHAAHDAMPRRSHLPTNGEGGAMHMAWIVGSERAPLITRNLPGPLLAGDEATVSAAASVAPARPEAPPAARPTALAARAGVPLAGRASLTVTEATAKLSRRCRKLLKAKRPSRLSKADRRRRAACLRQRNKLIAASDEQPAPTTPPPTPTPAPGTTTPPQSTTPGSPTPVVTPTPTPDPANPCAGKNPCVAAVGVTAKDDGTHFYFTLSRASVVADRVSFEFANADAQDHNLFVEQKGKPETAVPVSTRLAPGGRVNVELALAPGTYQLRCLIQGHESMVVDFVVQAPAR